MTDVFQRESTETLLADSLTDQQVAEYLEANPDFFSQYPDLLTELTVNHSERGAISLVEMQLTRLRQQVQEKQAQLDEMVTLAEDNSLLFHKFADVQQRLLQTHSIYHALEILGIFAESLDLEVSLKLFDALEDRLYLPWSRFDAFRHSYLNNTPAYLGRLRQSDSEMFFAHPPQLGSFLVMPLGHDEPQGVLCFASADGGHFQPEMDTLFVEQLASLLSRLIQHWEYSEMVLG